MNKCISVVLILCGYNMVQIVQELLQTSESAQEIMEVPTESDVPDADQTGESCARFHSVSVQTCPPRSVKCQVSPKSSCKGEKSNVESNDKNEYLRPCTCVNVGVQVNFTTRLLEYNVSSLNNMLH